MKDRTASEIVELIRAVKPDGSPALTNGEAALLVSLFASVAVARAERNLVLAPSSGRLLHGARSS